MQNPKLDGVTWTSDTRADQIDTYTETHTTEDGEQTAEYKLITTHPIIGGVLDKLAFLRTHASAVWYNKLAGITVLQKIDNIVSNIGTLTALLTADKTSLVAAVNELNGKIDAAGYASNKFFFCSGVLNETLTPNTIKETGVYIVPQFYPTDEVPTDNGMLISFNIQNTHSFVQFFTHYDIGGVLWVRNRWYDASMTAWKRITLTQ